MRWAGTYSILFDASWLRKRAKLIGSCSAKHCSTTCSVGDMPNDSTPDKVRKISIRFECLDLGTMARDGDS